jgi:hypothetical protein
MNMPMSQRSMSICRRGTDEIACLQEARQGVYLYVQFKAGGQVLYKKVSRDKDKA